MLIWILTSDALLYLLPVVLTDLHISDIHQLVQGLSLLSEPFIAAYFVSFVRLLGHFEKQLQFASKGFVVEEIDFRDLEAHDVDEDLHDLLDIFLRQPVGPILRLELLVDGGPIVNSCGANAGDARLLHHYTGKIFGLDVRVDSDRSLVLLKL